MCCLVDGYVVGLVIEVLSLSWVGNTHCSRFYKVIFLDLYSALWDLPPQLDKDVFVGLDFDGEAESYSGVRFGVFVLFLCPIV